MSDGGDSDVGDGPGGPGGSVPWNVMLLIAVIFFAVWGLLSLTR